VLILDKPAGLAVHAGPRGGPSLEDWLPQLAFGKKRLPQPAHRLDMDTAGCLVLGRTKPALAALGAIFAAQQARKTYWAVVQGQPATEAGEIVAPLIKRSTARDGWWMSVDPAGQTAVTGWRVLGRAHCAHIGCPILGDARYGGGEGRMHLLARAIRLPLEPPVNAVAAPPPHMQDALSACGWRP
jgi:tRNA pseudouridine32 synthase/23S rRNA pseudouridine746 synthase